MLLLLLSVFSIALGYYLLLSVSPDTPFEEVIKRARGGVILNLIGGVLMMLYIYKRSK